MSYARENFQTHSVDSGARNVNQMIGQYQGQLQQDKLIAMRDAANREKAANNLFNQGIASENLALNQDKALREQADADMILANNLRNVTGQDALTQYSNREVDPLTGMAVDTTMPVMNNAEGNSIDYSSKLILDLQNQRRDDFQAAQNAKDLHTRGLASSGLNAKKYADSQAAKVGMGKSTTEMWKQHGAALDSEDTTPAQLQVILRQAQQLNSDDNLNNDVHPDFMQALQKRTGINTPLHDNSSGTKLRAKYNSVAKDSDPGNTNPAIQRAAGFKAYLADNNKAPSDYILPKVTNDNVFKNVSMEKQVSIENALAERVGSGDAKDAMKVIKDQAIKFDLPFEEVANLAFGTSDNNWVFGNDIDKSKLKVALTNAKITKEKNLESLRQLEMDKFTALMSTSTQPGVSKKEVRDTTSPRIVPTF